MRLKENVAIDCTIHESGSGCARDIQISIGHSLYVNSLNWERKNYGAVVAIFDDHVFAAFVFGFAFQQFLAILAFDGHVIARCDNLSCCSALHFLFNLFNNWIFLCFSFALKFEFLFGDSFIPLLFNQSGQLLHLYAILAKTICRNDMD